METLIGIEDSPVDLLHELGVQPTASGEFHDVLERVVEFATALVGCDSCLIYVLAGEDLILRSSKNAASGGNGQTETPRRAGHRLTI